MRTAEFSLVVGGRQEPQGLVESGWKKLVEGLRANLERMKAQPKYPPIPEDDE